MNLEINLRELSAREIIARSTSLYIKKFRFYLSPFLLLSLVNYSLAQLANYFIPDFAFTINFTEEYLLKLINYMVVAVPLAARFLIAERTIVSILDGICTKYTSDIVEEQSFGVMRGFSFAGSMVSSLFEVGFLKSSLSVLGIIVFIIPSIIVTVMFSLSVQIMVIERVHVFESLRRSRIMVAKRWGKTFMILFILSLLTFTAYVIGDIASGFLGTSTYLIIISISTSILHPLYPITMTFLYYSMKVRQRAKELELHIQPIVPVPSKIRLPTPIISTFQPKFCYKCGQSLPSDATYCPRCGVRVRS